MIGLPPTLLIAAGACAVAFAAGGLTGLKIEAWRCQAARAEAVQRTIDQATETARQDAEFAAMAEAHVEAVRVINRTLTQEVVRYVETHPAGADCLDADGLRLWRAANAGTAPDAAFRADYALHGTATARLGTAGGPVGQPHGGGPGISPLPGAPQGFGGLGDDRPPRPHWGWP